MASIAERAARGAFPLALERAVFGAAPRPRASAGSEVSAELTTARLLAGVGVGSLVSLPFLMLASIVLEAPLAVPAAIAAGHLATAHALANGRRRRAAIWSFAVLAGFVLWTLLAGLVGEAPFSGAALAAVLLAPSFAAAPALAQRLSAIPSHQGRAAAERDALCLDRLAPTEAVLFLDASGLLIAATRAGRGCLELGPQADATDVGRYFAPADRPLLRAALARCRLGEAPQEIVLRRAGDGSGAEAHAATLAAWRAGAMTMRLRQVEASEPQADTSTPSHCRDASVPIAANEPCPPSPAVCDVREAIAFALTRLDAEACAKGVATSCRADARIVAVCDRQLLRRILSLVTETALIHSRPGGELAVSARPLRGAVLVRVACEADGDPLARRFGEALAATPAAALVDRASGSLVVEADEGSVAASIRLALPRTGMADRNPRQGRAAA